MRLVIQRVKKAWVEIKQRKVASIERGLLVLVAFSKKDVGQIMDSPLWEKIIFKIPRLRIFPDKTGRLNLDLQEYDGEILVVSQFTLYGNMKRGRRPCFSEAAPAKEAEELYKNFLSTLYSAFPKIKEGVFGAEMEVYLCNWGPVTLIMDSEYMK